MPLAATVSARDNAPSLSPAASRTLDIALLGLGRVGSAVASLVLNAPGALGRPVRLTGALVRDRHRTREDGLHRRVPVTDDALGLLAGNPDLVVEVLGGLEPARTIVLQALQRGIPVVTANKSLMAAHGDELLAAAAASGAALRYEACVLAGVPFLGTFAARPLASRVSRVTGIVNGTTNYILTRMEREHLDFEDVLADAQRLGFAEPDPASDVDGIDAVDKLAVLIRHFGHRSVRTAGVETRGIRAIEAADLRHAREFGGVIKLVVDASWDDLGIEAFAGPAFVPAAHRLSRIDGVENAICLHGAGAALFYSGPGAGPAVTAATILDDVAEIAARPAAEPQPYSGAANRVDPGTPATAWFVRVAGLTVPGGPDLADLLGSFGVWLRRVSPTDSSSERAVCYLLTFPCSRERLERALAALGDASSCETFAIRTLEA